LRKKVEHNISVLEHNRIKQENESLKELVRELVGWSVSKYHTSTLIIKALFDALHNQKT